MPSRHRSWILAALVLGVPAALAAACGPPQPPNGPDSSTTASPPEGPTASPTSAPTTIASSEPTAPPPAEIGPGPDFTCALPAPVRSQDACKTDADCAPSDPCHAHACVARAKAHPPDKSTMCTQMMDCKSVDANPCVCFESVCALVPPPKPPTQ